MSSAPEKPTVVFVPGAWHLPEGFDQARTILTKNNYPSVAPALPSVDAEPPTKTLNDDIDYFHKVLADLADQGKQLIVIPHSYGGLVGAGAVKGLGYAERAKAGKKGGVIMLMYMSAFVVPKGKSLKDMLGGQFLPWMKFDGNYCHSSDQHNIFYHDLPKEEQEKWISKLKHTSASVFSDAATNEPWNDGLPCMFLFCDQDHAIPPPVQDGMSKLLGEGAPGYHADASHSVFLSKPECVKEACDVATKAGREKSGILLN
ncbi:MAG: hypothetical protein M1834_001486 [Cirrosporium novae-zelandiae]|nr:MAG: hypothetical protein M1834_008608 [Cirrosporium novae-zelandiae]KAI9736020.1 MAG: hypothetical protein M1834_001486 [Cirrosporium novae-zelandiae]